MANKSKSSHGELLSQKRRGEGFFGTEKSSVRKSRGDALVEYNAKLPNLQRHVSLDLG
jgi:hypothetical protein